MQLRPHHLLCTQTYAGKGYSPSFVKNMDHITQKLRTESETVIEIVFSTDSLCAHCPNQIEQNLCEANEKVNEMDRKMISHFQLEEKSYIYQDLIKEINEKMTPEMQKDICGQCEWYSIC